MMQEQGGKGLAILSSFTNQSITLIIHNLKISPCQSTAHCGQTDATKPVSQSASSYMHRGPHAWSWAWLRARLFPQENSGLCAKGGQAEASTLLHESSNSEPETI